MLDSGRVTVESDTDDVEPDRAFLEVVGGEVFLGKAAELLLFALPDRKRRGAECARSPGLHLDEHHGITVLADEVDLAQSCAVVSSKHSHPLIAQSLASEVLASAADGRAVHDWMQLRTGPNVCRCTGEGPLLLSAMTWALVG